MLDPPRIAAALREIALLLPLVGENRFKARAYERGADAIERLEGDLGELVDARRLTSIDGVGEALAARIAELYLTGRSAYLEELRAALPAGVAELARVPGLSARTVVALREALGIESLAALEAACAAGRVRALRGFGARSEEKILEAVRRYRERGDRWLLPAALEAGERLLAALGRAPGVAAAALGGEARRHHETVAGLALVAGLEGGEAGPDQAAALLEALPGVEASAGPPSHAGGEGPGEPSATASATAALPGGLAVRLEVVPVGRLAGALLSATAGAPHRARLAALARAGGLDDRWLEADSEEAIYARLGLPPIPPELQDDEAAIDEALAGGRFDELVDLPDVRGLVHCHTRYSDGQNSVEEMARAADALGMEYLTITDHSPAAFYASGVGLDALARQWDEIARVQERVKVRLLRGTESDILADGALDYPDRVLEQMDVVIASVHSRFRMDEGQMTRRLVAAMRHPLFKIWGHALGRLVLRREPFAARVEEVLDAIAASRAAIEVNGDPHRLDLAPPWIRAARARGIPFVISTDAHSVANLAYLRYGVWTARRGGLRRREVLNTLPAPAFVAAVRPAGA